MTVAQARKAMEKTGKLHTQQILLNFSPAVAELMLKCMSVFCDATREQVREGRDTRDIVVTLSHQMMEADNMSTILAKDATDSILKGLR